MWVRRIVGFLAGFIGSFVLIAAFGSTAGFVPRGAGWLILMIAVGGGCSKLFSNPKAVAQDVNLNVLNSTAGVRQKWWELTKGLRLIVIGSFIWFFASYLGQDNYDRSMKLVFFPILIIFACHFGYRHLVNSDLPNSRSAPPAAAPSKPTLKDEDANEWLTAFHEAGHLLAAYHSANFVIKDEAVRLGTAGPGALADVGITGPANYLWNADIARDFAVIGFGGYIAEMILTDPEGGLKRNWIVKYDGTVQDQKMIATELAVNGISGEYQELAARCLKVIHVNQDKLMDLAQVIFDAIKANAQQVRKADLLPILSRSARIE